MSSNYSDALAERRERLQSEVRSIEAVVERSRALLKEDEQALAKAVERVQDCEAERAREIAKEAGAT